LIAFRLSLYRSRTSSKVPVLSRRTQEQAREKNETNFMEWFEELVQKAEKLRAGAGR
jgi:hypothetical protein